MVAGSHALRRETNHRSAAAIGVALLLLIVSTGGMIWWRAAGATGSEGGCDPERVRLAVARDLAPVVQQVVAEVAEEHCVEFVVSTVTPNVTVASLVADKPDAPALWIPDSRLWVQQVEAQGVKTVPLAESVATSPVVLVGGPTADPPTSWLAALGSGQLAMRDPRSSGTGALTLASVRAEAATTKATEEQVGQVIVPLAQRFGQGTGNADPVAGLTATSVQVVPTSEQAYLTAKRTNPELTAVVPATGVLLQDYPFVASAVASPTALEAGRALSERLRGPEGRNLLARAGFRAPDRAPVPGGVGPIQPLEPPPVEAVRADLQKWLVLSVPSSLLTVMDVSGSMDDMTPNGTRIQLAAAAARAALGAYPDAARIGLWAFSIDQGGKGIDHRELVPLRRLDASVNGAVQRAQLDTAISGLAGITRDGTGLYDTTLAAYRQALLEYDAHYFNAVVILTDGANDDPGSISLAKLIATLKKESDPERPVRIFALGISQEADLASLTKIAQATNGGAFVVNDPRSVLPVLAKALMGR